jgi:hypothetical protein
MDRWLTLMTEQAGFAAARGEEAHTVDLVPMLTLQEAAPTTEVEIQIPSEGQYTLTLNGHAFSCTCVDSPRSRGAAYVEHARPHAPLRVRVAPGDEVAASLEVAWTTRKGKTRAQTLFDGAFTVPDEVHKLGSPGYNVNLAGLKTQFYLCVAKVGTAEVNHLELMSFHMTLLYT